MGRGMKVIGKMTYDVVLELKNGLMDPNTKDNSKTIKSMELVILYGQIIQVMRETL